MDKTVRLAKENSVRVGAHPSLPDRQGFGRREMIMDSVRHHASCITVSLADLSLQEELAQCFVYQVGALSGFLTRHGLPLNHVRLMHHMLLLTQINFM